MRPMIIALCAAVAPLAAASADGVSPYAGEEARAIKALSPDEIAELRAGRGMGLAKAAELNGYPGPAHVLELADRLDLTPAQRQATQELFDTMNRDARRLGQAIIEAEQDLETGFAEHRMDERSLAAKLDVLAALHRDLRFSHLRTHLAQAALLTPGQVARYRALRGYAADDNTTHRHQHGGTHN